MPRATTPPNDEELLRFLSLLGKWQGKLTKSSMSRESRIACTAALARAASLIAQYREARATAHDTTDAK